MNGKGDRDRTADREAFRRNWDEIDWGNSKASKETHTFRFASRLMVDDRGRLVEHMIGERSNA